MSLSPSDLQGELELYYMDAMTAAYDANDPQLVEKLEQAMRESGMGVADPSSTRGIEAMQEVMEVLTEAGVDTSAINQDLAELAGPTQGTVLKMADPTPPDGLIASADDVEDIKIKEQPKIPSVGGPLGI